MKHPVGVLLSLSFVIKDGGSLTQLVFPQPAPGYAHHPSYRIARDC